jgi:hypothetical protein
MDKIQTPLGLIEVDAPDTRKSRMKFSRLYGFVFDSNGSIIPVESEQSVIRFVVETFARSDNDVATTATQIVSHLTKLGIRNRSNKRFTPRMTIELIRPIFGGRIKSGAEYIESFYYPSIVEWKVVHLAMKKTGQH